MIPFFNYVIYQTFFSKLLEERRKKFVFSLKKKTGVGIAEFI